MAEADRTNRDLSNAVMARLDEDKVDLFAAANHRQIVDTIVWETLAVLGEWGMENRDD